MRPAWLKSLLFNTSHLTSSFLPPYGLENQRDFTEAHLEMFTLLLSTAYQDSFCFLIFPTEKGKQAGMLTGHMEAPGSLACTKGMIFNTPHTLTHQYFSQNTGPVLSVPFLSAGASLGKTGVNRGQRAEVQNQYLV